MGGQSPLAADDPAATRVPADQALFTSLRSPLGEGYRIVAASPGLTAAEKREITRRCPSHDSLTAPSPDGLALASYPLRSGRHCVALSHPAGPEQSGRGGHRVCTHIVVLRSTDFRRFRCDPLAVQAALGGIAGPHPPPRPELRLRQVLLAVRDLEHAAPCRDLRAPDRAGLAQGGAAIAAALLEGRRLVVRGAPAPRAVLGWALRALPLGVRRRLGVSFGLKLAPARMFGLTFVDGARGALERLVRGQAVLLCDWGALPGREGSPFDAWVRFVRVRWEHGRGAEAERLCCRLAEDAPAEYLRRLAELSLDLDLARAAHREALTRLADKYARYRPQAAPDAELLCALGRVIEARRGELCRERRAAPASGPGGCGAPAPVRGGAGALVSAGGCAVSPGPEPRGAGGGGAAP